MKIFTNHHDTLLNVYGFAQDADRFYVVTDARRTDERDELQEAVMLRGRFSEKDAALFTRTLFEAVGYCHSNNIVHKFLCPENILLKRNCEMEDIKVINFNPWDFGKNTHLNEKFSPPHFLAPEVCDGGFNEKSDAWSAGAIIYFLLSGQPPFSGNTDQEIINNIKTAEVSLHSPVWESISAPAKELLM